MQWGKRQLAGEYEFIVDTDPALDRSVPDFADRYARYRDTGNKEELPVLPGARPVVFVLTHPYGMAYAHLQEEYSKLTMDKAVEQPMLVMRLCYRACQLALRRVIGLADPENEGKEFVVALDTDPVTGLKRVTELCMGHLQNLEDSTGYHGSVVVRLGEEVARRLFVVPLSQRG